MPDEVRLSVLLFVCSPESLHRFPVQPDPAGYDQRDSFGVFTDHFCRYLDKLYGVNNEQRNKVLLIADGAGAHLEELCTDNGFDFKKLPAASPELNPVERFFEELRKDLADHVFDTIEQVEVHLISMLQKYYQNPQVIIQLTQFPYISLPT